MASRQICVALLALGVGGCMTYQLPHPLTAEQKQTFAKSPFHDLTVAVRAGRSDRNSSVSTYEIERFATLLRDTQLFKGVYLESQQGEAPNLIVILNDVRPKPLCATGEASLM